MKTNMNRETKLFVSKRVGSIVIQRVFRTFRKAKSWIQDGTAIVTRYSQHGYTSETCGRYAFREGRIRHFNRGFTAEMYDSWTNWLQE